MHGISREQLVADGKPAAEVARRAIEVLARPDVLVYSDAPGWDQGWLDEIFSAAGLPPSQIVLRDVTEAYAAACKPVLRTLTPQETPEQQRAADIRAVTMLIAVAQENDYRNALRRHRALDDAQGLQGVHAEIRRRVSLSSEDG